MSGVSSLQASSRRVVSRGMIVLTDFIGSLFFVLRLVVVPVFLYRCGVCGFVAWGMWDGWDFFS